jgi:prepilin-type processing-associated H-X9-DG protein
MTASILRRRHGFTLIDLLMLIVIAALLIAVLAPLRALANQAAALTACQYNLQQIGIALQAYNDINGVMPWGQLEGTPDRETCGWPEALSQELGITYPPKLPKTSPVMVCPNALVSRQDQVWKSDSWFHYCANPRAMPMGSELHGVDRYTDPDNPMKNRLRSLQSINNPSAIALIWDGAQVELYNWSASYLAEITWGLDNPPQFVYPPRDNAVPLSFYDGILPFDADGNTDMEHNIDVPKSLGKRYCFVRYRHGNNDTINILFADGHVEARKYGEFLWKDVCMNYQ